MPAVACRSRSRNRQHIHRPGPLPAMTLWGRLAIAMVLLVVATGCALSLFAHALAGLAIAAVLALVLAAGMARSLSRPLTQMTRAVEGLSRGETVSIPSTGCREIAGLAAAFAELAVQFGTRQDLLAKTVESIRDSVVVADENGVIVVANAAARRLLGVAPGFNSLTGTRSFACFLVDDVTPMAIPDFTIGACDARRQCRRFRARGATRSPRRAGVHRRQRAAVARRTRPASRRGHGSARYHRAEAGAPGAGRQRADGAVHHQELRSTPSSRPTKPA